MTIAINAMWFGAGHSLDASQRPNKVPYTVFGSSTAQHYCTFNVVLDVLLDVVVLCLFFFISEGV